MKRLLSWLNPITEDRGFVFGYLFGVVWWLALVALLSPSVSEVPSELARRGARGLILAIPWALLWSVSGALANARSYPATVLTAGGIVCGMIYSLWKEPWGNGQGFAMLVASFVGVAAFHFVAFAVACVLRLNREDD